VRARLQGKVPPISEDAGVGRGPAFGKEDLELKSALQICRGAENIIGAGIAVTPQITRVSRRMHLWGYGARILPVSEPNAEERSPSAPLALMRSSRA
jgi:hypothetical protein